MLIRTIPGKRPVQIGKLLKIGTANFKEARANMNTGLQDKQRKNPLRIVVWGAAAGLLLLPWAAMQFTSEVAWVFMDFVLFGAMLMFVCGSYELITRMSGNSTFRLAAGVALLAGFVLVWVNGAVGIIGTEGNPVNAMFYFIPMIALTGALAARFKPAGMARAMSVTAIAQALTSLVALVIAGAHIFVLTACFVLLWLTSALLFQKAAKPTALP